MPGGGADPKREIGRGIDVAGETKIDECDSRRHRIGETGLSLENADDAVDVAEGSRPGRVRRARLGRTEPLDGGLERQREPRIPFCRRPGDEDERPARAQRGREVGRSAATGSAKNIRPKRETIWSTLSGSNR